MPSYTGRGLHGQTVQALGRRVVEGRWQPGDTIYPDELESEMGVSKTVIREALRVLGAKGLVDSRPKRGTFVRERAAWSLLDTDVIRWQLEGEHSKSFFADLAEVRAMVEPACARLAAERRTNDDLEALRVALQDMANAAGDADAAIAADLAFHRALLTATHNELLAQLDIVITTALDARDRVVHKAGDKWRDPSPVHQLVLDRIEARDAEGSVAAMLDLLAVAQADVKRVGRRSAKSK